MSVPAETVVERLLRRSEDLHEALLDYLDGCEFDSSPRGEASLGMCSLSLEHAQSVRILIASGCPTSAVGLTRLQFEVQVRAMWLLYAASDAAIEKLSAPLTIENELENLPVALVMIDEIGKQVGVRAPAAAHQMLVQFRDVSWRAMNSFVHGGIHALRRHADGFPLPMLVRVQENSNALTTMTGMSLAVLTGDRLIVSAISRIQHEFADCLPELLVPPVAR